MRGGEVLAWRVLTEPKSPQRKRGRGVDGGGSAKKVPNPYTDRNALKFVRGPTGLQSTKKRRFNIQKLVASERSKI